MIVDIYPAKSAGSCPRWRRPPRRPWLWIATPHFPQVAIHDQRTCRE